MKHLVGRTRNGALVHVDLITSAAAKRIAQQPHLLGLAGEALKKTALRDTEIRFEYDTERTIGYDYVIGTTDKDSVFYAQLLRDTTYTRFVKNGKPVPAQRLAIVLRKNDDGNYELLDTWIGHLSPPKPGSTGETPESKTYWATHALILDNQPIQLRTLTKVCPY